MKIAYLSTFPPYRGGIAQFNVSLYKALADRGHSMQAFTFTRQYPGLLFPGKTQFATDRNQPDPIRAKRALDSMNPLTYRRTAEHILAFHPDVLLMKFWMSFFGPSLGYVAGKVKSHSMVITILDNVIPHEKHFFDVALTKYFLKRNDGFIAMSDAVYNDLQSLRPQAPCLRIDHPLYDHFGRKIPREVAMKRLGLQTGLKTILFFGIIRDYKGLDILIDAFNKLDNSFQLLIAGECYGSEEKYHRAIKHSPANQRIHFFPHYIPDDKVSEFFSASDVCVLPYRSATQSGITAISYHFELPLIATDVGGLKESIAGDGTGMTVKAPDAEMIAGAINIFFNNNLASDYITNIKRLKEKKSWKRFADNTIKFVRTLK